MTFPNPANYYLPLPEDLEERIQNLSLLGHASLNRDLALYIYERIEAEGDDSYAIDTSALTVADDEFITKLRYSQLISFQRWIAERLAWFESQEKSNHAQS